MDNKIGPVFQTFYQTGRGPIKIFGHNILAMCQRLKWL